MLTYENNFPKGDGFFKFVHSKDVFKESLTLDIYKSDNEFQSLETYETIPEFLEVLYKVSSCKFGCKGGPHVIEYITGRGYNLGIASMKLIKLGFYDESISLIRSISEIVNLFALFAIDINSAKEWYSSSERDRIKNFTPGKIRKRLSQSELSIPISQKYYSKMCEVGVHVNPATKPQGHNNLDRAIVGGVVFKEQAIAVLNDLSNTLGWLAMMALRNSVDKEIFIKEMDRLKPNYDKIGSLSLETIQDYLNRKYDS